jgi:hypothetical protein
MRWRTALKRAIVWGIGSSFDNTPAYSLPVFAQRQNAANVLVHLEKTFVDSFARNGIRDDAADALSQIADALEAV